MPPLRQSSQSNRDWSAVTQLFSMATTAVQASNSLFFVRRTQIRNPIDPPFNRREREKKLSQNKRAE